MTELSRFWYRLAVSALWRHLRRIRNSADCLLHNADQNPGFDIIFSEPEHRNICLEVVKVIDELILLGFIEGVT